MVTFGLGGRKLRAPTPPFTQGSLWYYLTFISLNQNLSCYVRKMPLNRVATRFLSLHTIAHLFVL